MDMKTYIVTEEDIERLKLLFNFDDEILVDKWTSELKTVYTNQESQSEKPYCTIEISHSDCSCGMGKRLLGEHYCENCLERNILLCT